MNQRAFQAGSFVAILVLLMFILSWIGSQPAEGQEFGAAEELAHLATETFDVPRDDILAYDPDQTEIQDRNGFLEVFQPTDRAATCRYVGVGLLYFLAQEASLGDRATGSVKCRDHGISVSVHQGRAASLVEYELDSGRVIYRKTVEASEGESLVLSFL